LYGVVLFPGILYSSSVELKWDPVIGSDAAGYKLYVGTDSRNYSNIIDIGPQIRCLVEELQESTLYYFAVTAYNDTGDESDFSNEYAFLPFYVLSPDGGEIIEWGSSYVITWEGDQNIRNVKIMLSTDAGREWRPVNVRITNDGRWSWKVPKVVSDSCLIKVTAYGNPDICDVSNDYFSISGIRLETDNDQTQSVPKTIVLTQNYPNPFNPMTTITFGVPENDGSNVPQHVTITIYDLRGRRLKMLVDRELIPGYHSVCWDGRDEMGGVVPSGVYFYGLTVGGVVASPRKMVLTR